MKRLTEDRVWARLIGNGQGGMVADILETPSRFGLELLLVDVEFREGSYFDTTGGDE